MRSNLFVTSLLAAINLLSIIAAPSCGLVPPKSSLTQSPPDTSSSSTEGVLATGWYAGWLGTQLPPSQISWTKYSALTFAFAVTTPDTSVLSLDTASAALLPTFVSEAHANGVNATLSIGGWSGSLYFSTAVSPQNRSTFVKTVVNLVNKYNLDGIDFDWEYPNHQGIGCNTISPDDSANFLAFLQDLRKDPVGARITLSAAVGITPFAGPDGTPMTDVSGFAAVLDHIAIMNYDVWGSWSASVGPNAPLNDTCASTKAGSAVSAVNAWTAAKFPASQIALGVAAYGHSFHVATTAAVDNTLTLVPYPPFDKSQQPLGDSDVPGAPPTNDECGNSVGVGGTFNFKSMITDGFLNATGGAADGIYYRFDDCSKTPYVYNFTSQVMISYDDATSFADKGKFIVDQNLAGFAMWQIAGDSNDILVSAISDAMGIAQECS
ncbi:endochitinase [Phlegmacium glaucopus]|nr:endochitinase [Phlegmacium glaucopus]